jgi:hypothetical protein
VERRKRGWKREELGKAAIRNDVGSGRRREEHKEKIKKKRGEMQKGWKRELEANVIWFRQKKIVKDAETE